MADTTTTGKKKMYRVNVRIAYKHPNMVTLVPKDLSRMIGPGNEGISVALGSKEVRRLLPAKADRPEMEMVSKPATQEQLKYLYEVERHPHIEQYEE